MTTISAQPSVSYSGRTICRIVGLACLIGFLIDLLLLLLPPAFNSAEWRVSVLQQLSDRGIILLFGAALLTYGCLESRSLRKQLGTLCLGCGVVLVLAGVAVVRDSFVLHDLAIKNINTQANQIQTQLQNPKPNPNTPQPVSPEQLQQAAKLLDTRAASLKEGAKTGIFKSGTGTVANLVVVGVALVSLGRYGLSGRKG